MGFRLRFVYSKLLKACIFYVKYWHLVFFDFVFEFSLCFFSTQAVGSTTFDQSQTYEFECCVSRSQKFLCTCGGISVKLPYAYKS
jgi:hypothetical protein